MPSARSPTAAPDRNPAARPRPRRVTTPSSLVRVRWDRVGRVGLLVVLTVVAGLYIQDAISYLSRHSQAEQQLSLVSHLVQDNQRLEQQQRTLNDPATIQRDARALGMVRPGERPYVITGLPNH